MQPRAKQNAAAMAESLFPISSVFLKRPRQLKSDTISTLMNNASGSQKYAPGAVSELSPSDLQPLNARAHDTNMGSVSKIRKSRTQF